MPRKHPDRCQYKNCREPSDIVFHETGRQLCMKHYEEHLREMDRAWVEAHPDFHIDGQGFIKKRPETPSQPLSTPVIKKARPSLDDFT